MHRWVKIVIISVPVILLVVLTVNIFLMFRPNQITILNLNPNYKLTLNQKILDDFNNEAIKIAPGGETIIFVSPFLEITKSGASYKGNVFMYEKHKSFFDVSFITVYLDKQAIESLDQTKMNETLGYFLLRQTLVGRGLDDVKQVSGLPYKYGITKSELFNLAKRK